MARKASKTKVTTATEAKTSQARLELPAEDMERIRKAAKSVGLSLSAFIRQAVIERAVDVERRMGR